MHTQKGAINFLTYVLTYLLLHQMRYENLIRHFVKYKESV